MTDGSRIPMTDDVWLVRLSSDELEVDILPANGADIQAIVDRRTGTSLLWTSPWARTCGRRTPLPRATPG